MPYTKVGPWNNGATPPISAANLDTVETQYDQAIADAGFVVSITKAGDEDVVSSTTLQNDDDFSFAVLANETWGFELHLRVSEPAGSGTPDIKWAWSVPAGVTGGHRVTNIGLATWIDLTSADTESNVDATERVLIIHGVISVGATPGTAQFQWAQNTSSGNLTRLHAESVLTAWRQGAI